MKATDAHAALEAAVLVADEPVSEDGLPKTDSRQAIDVENVRTAALVAIACELHAIGRKPGS